VSVNKEDKAKTNVCNKVYNYKNLNYWFDLNIFCTIYY
jgi:hypothetical protein